MRATVEGTDEIGYLPAWSPDASLLAAVASDMAPLRPSTFAIHGPGQGQNAGWDRMATTSVGTPAELLLELAGVKAAIRTWWEKQPDEVVREAMAYSARLTELWTELRLLEPYDRSYAQMRTMQVAPVLDEIDRQTKLNSSRIAMLRQDLDMVIKGGGA